MSQISISYTTGAVRPTLAYRRVRKKNIVIFNVKTAHAHFLQNIWPCRNFEFPAAPAAPAFGLFTVLVLPIFYFSIEIL